MIEATTNRRKETKNEKKTKNECLLIFCVKIKMLNSTKKEIKKIVLINTEVHLLLLLLLLGRPMHTHREERCMHGHLI
jgi:hypothetical protein